MGLGVLSSFSIRPSGVNEGLCNDVNDCREAIGKRAITRNGRFTHNGSANFFGNK